VKGALAVVHHVWDDVGTIALDRLGAQVNGAVGDNAQYAILSL
jgi:hypothetical protein